MPRRTAPRARAACSSPMRVLTTAIVVETRMGELHAALALGAVLLGIALLVTAFLVILERE